MTPPFVEGLSAHLLDFTFAIGKSMVAKDSAAGGPILFDFCIYQLSFVPKPDVPVLDGGALEAVD